MASVEGCHHPGLLEDEMAEDGPGMKDTCRCRERGRSREKAASASDSKRCQGSVGTGGRNGGGDPLLKHSEAPRQVGQMAPNPPCTYCSRNSGKSFRFPRNKVRATSISQGCCRDPTEELVSVSAQPGCTQDFIHVPATVRSCLCEDLGRVSMAPGPLPPDPQIPALLGQRLKIENVPDSFQWALAVPVKKSESALGLQEVSMFTGWSLGKE